MANRVAVIDLGSNTFHLLVVDLTISGLEFVYRERAFVYLAQGGKEHINQDRFEYGIEVLTRFTQKAKELSVREIRGIGTSALRSADNAADFIHKALSECGLEIEIISGTKEAQLIHKGVTAELQSEEPVLIMDIGGGSLELIASQGGEILGLDSLPLGISHLRSVIQYSEPITQEEYESISSLIKGQLQGILNWCGSPGILAGASGPFEIIESLFKASPMHGGNSFELEEVKPIIKEIIFATLEGRMSIEGMPAKRADLALESMLLIDAVLKLIPSLRKITVTSYALKEGYLISKHF